MSHAYPADLARLVHERLRAEVAPSCDHPSWREPQGLSFLERLLSICYQASLLREEERPLAFRVALVEPFLLPEDGGPPEGLHRIRFSEPRSLTANELRRLAPAAKFQRSLIGVQVNGEGEPVIWGLLQSGPGWLRAVQGGRNAAPEGLPVLTIAVTGPGRIIVSRGAETFARLVGGHLSGALVDVFKSVWLPDSFKSVRKELIELYAADSQRFGQPRAQLNPELIGMIGQHFIRRIVATIRLARHGGTLLIVPPECAEGALSEGRYVRLKYQFENEEPRQRFRTLLLRALRALADAHGLLKHPLSWADYNASNDPHVALLDEAIFELAHWIAGLADVDGAVLLTHRFEVLGFGGEIAGELADVSTVMRAFDLEGLERLAERPDGVGTRHRSVYRLCQAFRSALGIVVSQDGGIRFVCWKDGAVTYWNQFSIGTLEL